MQRLPRAAVSAPAGPGTGTSMRDASARVALPGPPESSLIGNTRDQRRLRTPCTAFGERSSLRPLSRECPWVPPRPSLAVLSLRCSDAHLSLRPVTDTDESGTCWFWARPGDTCCPHRHGSSSGAQGQREPRDGSVAGRSRPHGAGQTGLGPCGRFRNTPPCPRLTSAPRSALAQTQVLQRSRSPTSALLSRSQCPGTGKATSSPLLQGSRRCRPHGRPLGATFTSQHPASPHSIERRSRNSPTGA